MAYFVSGSVQICHFLASETGFRLATLVTRPAFAVLPKAGKTQGGCIGIVEKGTRAIRQIGNDVCFVVSAI